MSSEIATIFSVFGEILGVCPCCGELFYLSEARPYLEGTRARSIIDELRSEERRLHLDKEQFDEIKKELHEQFKKAGLKATKNALEEIDAVFSGAGYDPQDVKVIFDPVPYVIFHGMSRGE